MKEDFLSIWKKKLSNQTFGRENCSVASVVAWRLAWAVVVTQVVAHRTMDREVPGSIPAGSWVFLSLLFFFSSANQWCVLNQVPRGDATLLFLQKFTKKKMATSAA